MRSKHESVLCARWRRQKRHGWRRRNGPWKAERESTITVCNIRALASSAAINPGARSELPTVVELGHRRSCMKDASSVSVMVFEICLDGFCPCERCSCHRGSPRHLALPSARPPGTMPYRYSRHSSAVPPWFPCNKRALRECCIFTTPQHTLTGPWSSGAPSAFRVRDHRRSKVTGRTVTRRSAGPGVNARRSSMAAVGRDDPISLALIRGTKDAHACTPLILVVPMLRNRAHRAVRVATPTDNSGIAMTRSSRMLPKKSFSGVACTGTILGIM